MPEPESAFDRAPLIDRAIGTYLDQLGSSNPTPGGGSAAGVVGALGTSLGLMVIALTSDDAPETVAALEPAQDTLAELRGRFTALAEADEQVFQRYRDAADMPKGTSEEKQARRNAMQDALKHAATVPLDMAEAAVALARTLVPVQQFGNPHLLADAQAAMVCAGACFNVCRLNINTNLAMIRDETWITDVANRTEALAAELSSITAQ